MNKGAHQFYSLAERLPVSRQASHKRLFRAGDCGKSTFQLLGENTDDCRETKATQPPCGDIPLLKYTPEEFLVNNSLLCVPAKRS